MKRRASGRSAPLSSRRDFRDVYERGRRARRDGVTVIAAPSVVAGGASRIGLVVPATVGKATVRNRIRRRLRAAVAETSPDAGYDIVVRAGGGAGEVRFQQLVGDVREALVAAGIPCGD